MKPQDYYIFEVKNLSIFKIEAEDQISIIDQISFTLRREQILTIIGESEAGKSFWYLFLFKLIDHLEDFKITGEAFFYTPNLEVVNLTKCPKVMLRNVLKNHISIILQNPTDIFNSNYSVGRQLIIFLKNTLLISYSEAAKRYYKVLNTIGITKAEVFKRRPDELSKGQKQKIILAIQALLPHSLILIDQPIYQLDSLDQKAILKIIERLRMQGKTILFINNSLSFVPSQTDQFVLMKDGRVLETGSTIDIFCNPKTLYTQSFVVSRPRIDFYLDFIPLYKDLEMYNFTQEYRIATGDVLLNNYIPQEEIIKVCRQLKDKPIILEVKDLNLAKRASFLLKKQAKRFIHELSFNLREGEILGIIGREGAGQEILAQAIANNCLNLEWAGQILLKGKPLEQKTLFKKIQYIHYDSSQTLDPNTTVEESLTEIIENHKDSLTGREIDILLLDLIEFIQFNKDTLKRYPGDFLQKQLLEIVLIRALCLEPDILIFNEPTAYLSSLERAEFLNLVKALHGRKGISCLYISSNPADLHFLAQRVLVLDRGKKVELGNSTDIFLHPQKQITKELISNFPCILPPDILRRCHVD